jgi:hypothetical protein
MSGLAIEPGCQVRFYFLTQNIYGNDLGPVTYGAWAPRSLPFRVRYRGYGDIEAPEPEDERIAKVAAECFDLDILSRGWGENTVHDVPTRKGRILPQLVEAAWNASRFTSLSTARCAAGPP